MNEEALERLIEKAKERMRQLSQTLYDASENDSLTDSLIDSWFDAMVKEITIYHQAADLLGQYGRGGGGAIPASDNPILNNSIRTQIAYLEGYRDQIKAKQSFGSAQMARSAMYGSAIRSSYWSAATDYLPLPAMPAEGTICHTNCKCRWEIEKLDGRGNYNAFWRRAADDSCSTCIARERIWSPLVIIEGELQ
jgi:hypothetical protein